MVQSNHSWEEETRKLLSAVQSELNKVDTQMQELQKQKDVLAREVEGYEIALQSYLRRTGRQESIKDNLRSILEKQPNHQERIKRIAERNNGVVRVGLVTDLLYNFGFIKSKNRANAYRIVYGLLLGMVEEGNFRKIAPSTFRFIGAQQSLLKVR